MADDTALSFHSFADWLASEEHRQTDWITVSRSCTEGDSRWATFSALAPASADVGAIFEPVTWGVREWIGYPSIEQADDDGWTFDPGSESQERDNGPVYIPFVIRRSFHELVPSYTEFDQTFLLFHEAFWDPASNEYRRVTDEGDVVTVARATRGECESLEVDAHHLRDYLAARHALLVRFHDHGRSSSAAGVIDDEFVHREIRGEDHFYDLAIRRDSPVTDQRTYSRLLGKDIVRGYTAPDPRHFWWKEPNREFETFIIGRDDDGSLKEATCDGDELRHPRTNPDRAPFLSPVYFRREVLAKYYDSPRRYRVEPDTVWCLSLWVLPYATSGDLLQVWLGDLGRIPNVEQRHWRLFNVEPRGSVPEYRIRRDFFAEWVETDDPIHDLRGEYERVNGAWRTAFGEPLILPMRAEDAHLYTGLRLPLNEDWPEFDDQIHALAKVLVDSLNVGVLKRVSGKEIGDDDIKGSLGLLAAALSALGRAAEEVERLLAPLHAIQNLRSSATGHRKGDQFDKVLAKLGMTDTPNSGRILRLVKDAISALAGITAATEARK